ncbi:hypothetical protein, partial [Paraburkholderia youngii]|uniref:hypothetical protein n=1 Tax=Paraburkholderia youngii TaxID=2782701 RepID=UPI001C3D2308
HRHRDRPGRVHRRLPERMSGSQITQNTTFLFSGNPTFLFGTYTVFVDKLYYVKSDKLRG